MDAADRRAAARRRVADGIDRVRRLRHAPAEHPERRRRRAARPDALSVPALLRRLRRRRRLPRRPLGRPRVHARTASSGCAACSQRQGVEAPVSPGLFGELPGAAEPRTASRAGPDVFALACGTASCRRSCGARGSAGEGGRVRARAGRRAPVLVGRRRRVRRLARPRHVPTGRRSGSTTTRSRAVAAESSARPRPAGARARDTRRLERERLHRAASSWSSTAARPAAPATPSTRRSATRSPSRTWCWREALVRRRRGVPERVSAASSGGRRRSAARTASTSDQYTLLLMVKGALREQASVGELARRLHLAHNGVVERVQRAEDAGTRGA